MWALFISVVTVLGGAWIANRWQSKSAREARFFDASADFYREMTQAANMLADLSGRRIYATQRVCLTPSGGPSEEAAYANLSEIIREWNEKSMIIELSIRSYFKTAALVEYEGIQADLVRITNKIISRRPLSTSQRQDYYIEVNHLRHSFFQFTRNMIAEARLLHRQMHFGVKIVYRSKNLPKLSTFDLFKQLFAYQIEGASVVRPPSDFGLPVGIDDARFGINEE